MNDSWTLCTVQDLIERGEAELKTGPFGTQLHASDYVGAGTPVINVRNIGFGDIKEEKLEFISNETVQRLSSHLLESDDIVFGRKGAVERHVLVRQKYVGWFQGSDCLRLRLKCPSIDPRFVSYYFLTNYHKSWMMNQCSHGATMASLNQKIIGRIPLHLPPLPTQHKIAAILSAYDDLIENNTRRIQILEEMAQNLYREWFVHFRFPGHEKVRMVDSELGPIPEGWKIKKVTDSILINPRTKVSKEGEKPYVPMSSLSDNSMLIGDLEYRKGNSGSKFKKADTLFARITPSLENGKTGFVQFLPSDNHVALGSTEFIVLRSKTLCPEYIYLLARSGDFRDNAIKSMTGASGRQRVQQACFEQFLIAHPDPKIIAIFHEVVSPFFRLIHVLAHKNDTIRRTRDHLLPKLISGKIDVNGLEIIHRYV